MIYRLSNVEGTYNLAYLDRDPVLRKRAEMILDLHWLLYALQTVDGQFGGAQNRFKSHYAGYHPERGTGWYYFGGRPGSQACMAALFGDYLPPDIVYRLLEQPEERGCFTYRERLTQFSPETGQPPHVYTCSYTTPEYVLGSSIAHNLAGKSAADEPQDSPMKTRNGARCNSVPTQPGQPTSGGGSTANPCRRYERGSTDGTSSRSGRARGGLGQ